MSEVLQNSIHYSMLDDRSLTSDTCQELTELIESTLTQEFTF